MELLDSYMEIRQQIFDYFGYVEDWRVLPLDDCRSMWWQCDGDTVCFAKTESELQNQEGDYYTNEVYKQRHLPKWIYEGPEYTMICVDTHTDGNQFLSVFNNARRKDESEAP